VTIHARFAVLVLASAALAGPALGQIPVMQPQFQVSQTTTSYQSAYGIAMDGAGKFVVTWLNRSPVDQTDDCTARLYDESGVSVGSQFAISPSATDQFDGPVAKDASGRFVVVWFENETVMGRRFQPDGTPLGTAFTVTTSGSNDVFVASDDAGNFVIVWSRFVGVGPEFDVLARRYDSSGAALGGEFPVNSYTPLQQEARGVARKGVSGQFVVTWSGFGAGGAGIWARIFDANGNPTTGEIPVNQGDVPNVLPLSTVAMNASGEFVVAWEGELANPAYQGIFARRFNSFGDPQGGQFPVTTAVNVDRRDPQIASDNAGNFVVTWTATNGDPDEDAVGARVYDRFGTALSAEFVVNEVTTGSQYGAHVAMNDTGNFVVAWNTPDGSEYGVVARRAGIFTSPAIDADTTGALQSPASAPGNGVIEPGETANVDPAWVNGSASELVLTGAATDFSGPAGATYTLDDASADYGTIAAGATGSCSTTANCYQVTVSAPATRPAPHWDAQLQEALSIGVAKTWPLHIGESFPDAPTDHPFYRFIETLFHKGVTGGCFGGGYCPANPVTRAQMAVFLLKARFGSAHIPPPCTGTVFTDVPCTGGAFDPWIEELAGLAITGGCGGGLYCPNNTVTRQQMAVFLLKALEGSAYLPPACTGIFDDVPCTPGTGFSDWIEELADRGITGGCNLTPPLYCPTNPNNRGQMAVFLTKTFGLVLYGP
jgi:hypothetical protein